MRRVYQYIGAWFDKNFTMRSLLYLVFALITDVPDWRSRIEYWGSRWHSVAHFFLFGPYGKITIVIVGIIVILADHRRIIRQRKTLSRGVPPLQRLEDEELHDQASRWLSKILSDKSLRVQRAILFGSIVHDHYPTSDVDVIVLFKPLRNSQAGKIGRKIKGQIGSDFNRRFAHRLHVQLYLDSEKVRCRKFLSGLGKYEELTLEEY